MTKTDAAAATRVMDRACKKAIRMIRAGEPRAEYEPVLTAAGIAADVLMEPTS